MLIDDTFQEAVHSLDLESMRKSQDTIYIIDSRFKLRGYNPSWVNFAKHNSGIEVLKKYPIGISILTAIPEKLKPFYRASYTSALTSRVVFAHDYECSSANQFRLFHQTAYPLPEAAGLIVTHHLIEQFNHPGPNHAFTTKLLDEHGHITQCCHCRKIRSPANQHAWLWVPSIVKTPPPNTSHSVCPRCLEFYYPDSS